MRKRTTAGREAASRRTSCEQRCCAYRKVPFQRDDIRSYRAQQRLKIFAFRFVTQLPVAGALASGLEAGTEKCASSMGTFCSTFSTLICARVELPLGACSTENG